MDTKFKLINAAQQNDDIPGIIAENIVAISKSINESPTLLIENIVQTVGTLKALVAAGKDLSVIGINPQSLAGIIAGAEFLASKLSSITDSTKQTNAYNILNKLTMGTGAKLSLGAAQQLANLAERSPNRWNLWKEMLAKYSEVKQPSPELARAFSVLQGTLERSMNAVANNTAKATNNSLDFTAQPA